MLVRITRTIVQSKEVEIDLVGTSEDKIDQALDKYIEKNKHQYDNIEDMSWDLDDIQIDEWEVIEYPEFETEEDE